VKYWVYCLPTDILGEGAGTVLANLRFRAHVDGIAIAVKYHASRDVLPHNPLWRVVSLPPGVFYRPLPRDDDALAPVVSPLLEGRDVLAEVTASAAEWDMEVSAWAVMLHDDTVDANHPAVQVNCWGDGAAGVLCPAHPAARAYVLATVEELVTYPVASLRLESVHYHGLVHGHHHERLLEEHSPLALWLLGLCFCDYCLTAAATRGVAADSLRGEVRRWLAASFERSPDDLCPSLRSLAGLFGEDIVGYVAARQEVVSSLVARLVEVAAAANVSITFVDMSIINAVRLYGAEDGHLAVDLGWMDGVDIRQIARDGADIEVTGYVDNTHRLAVEVAGYRAAMAADSRLSVVLRPGLPDCRADDQLQSRVIAARGAGCCEIAFYNYGLYRLAALDRIRSAVEQWC
jgi:hypothetical protein